MGVRGALLGEGRAYAPDCAECEKGVESPCGQAHGVGVDCEVRIVQRREQTPAPIYLGVVLVDLRDNQKDGSEGYRYRNGGDQRVGGDVESFELLQTRGGLEKLSRKLVQLGDVWGNGLAEVGAVADRFYNW